MNEKSIEYVSAGRVFSGFLVAPADSGANAPRPGVLVLHGGAGLGAHERERARMLAELGYVAFAPDIFGEKFESRAHGVQVITSLVAASAVLRARVNDALLCLGAQAAVDVSRTAAIGFCFGGLAALELARCGADVRCVVSFHGGLATSAPAETGVVRASILVCTGAADPFITREHRGQLEDEMTRAKADWQMNVYADAMHSFTERDANSAGAQFHEPSDRRSWSAMRALFQERL